MNNTTLIVITVLIAVIIMALIHIYNKNKLEHFELSTEAVRNLTNTCKQEDIVYNTGNFNNLTANTINSNSIISSKNGTLDNITVANLDVSNNFTGKQGKFDTVRSKNLYGDVTGESGTFTTMNTKNLNTDKLSLKNVNVNKLCFTPTNCITKDTISSMLLLDSPISSYMYLPNTPLQTYNFILPPFSDTTSYIFDPSRNVTATPKVYPKFIKIQSTDKIIIEAVGESMTIKSDTTHGTPAKMIIRSNNTTTPTQSGNQPQDNGNGLKIIVPPKDNKMPSDYTVLWVQVINKTPDNYWQSFRVYDLIPTTTNVRKYYGKYVGGANKLNNIDPTGSAQTDTWDQFEWIPVPIDLTGNASREIYISNFHTLDTSFSGFAFSTNPWNHAKSSAVSLNWRVNMVDTSLGIDDSPTDRTTYIKWEGIELTNNTQLASFVNNTSPKFRIPYVNSQRNKIFYIAAWNNDKNPGIIGLETYINGVWEQLGSFYTTFDNPFSRHFNSKTSLRYIGVIIPKDLLPPSRVGEVNFINLKITVAPGSNLLFTEVGTHDENPFDDD
jgi:hypothetical protein